MNIVVKIAGLEMKRCRKWGQRPKSWFVNIAVVKNYRKRSPVTVLGSIHRTPLPVAETEDVAAELADFKICW